MLWSIDSCLNRVTADQYHLTVSRAQVLTHQGQVFFWSYPLTSYLFSNDRRLKFFFFNWYEICCVYVHALHPIFVLWLVKIWQDSEFMRKIYEASWILLTLFTLTAEADRVLCNSAAMRSLLLFMASLINFVFWVFGWEICHLPKSEMATLFSFFTLLDA